MTKKLFIAFFVVVFFLVGIYFFRFEHLAKKSDGIFVRCNEKYTFLNNNLDCSSIDQDIDQLSSLHQNIKFFLEQSKSNGEITEAGVFFRDLNSTRWFGINENVNFYPASLSKLPFSMMMYKAAEIDKEILNEPIQIDDIDLNLNEGQHYQPSQLLTPGTYSVRELLRRLLVFSDNAPTNKLMELSAPLSQPILNDLGVLFPPDTQSGEAKWNITPKIYANFFRILYNSSYLRPEYSNDILEQLSQAKFKNGLSAGLPEEIATAHKFGEASMIDAKTGGHISVLSDCGIIYKRNSPYILCIMTQGGDYQKLEQVIQNISKAIYQYSLE